MNDDITNLRRGLALNGFDLSHLSDSDLEKSVLKMSELAAQIGRTREDVIEAMNSIGMAISKQRQQQSGSEKT